MNSPTGTRNQTAWRRSAAFKAIAKAACRKMNRLNAQKPRCGAWTRSAGGRPCRNAAMSNGKCHLHGGSTPSGKDWHVTQWPDRNAPDADAKWAAKARTLRVAAAKRVRRLKQMTPEQRAEYRAWQRTHKPGPAVKRLAARQDSAQAKAAAERMARPDVHQVTPEHAENRRRLAELKSLVVAGKTGALADELDTSNDEGILT
ncbi:MAG TPA: hypothetical protein VLA00_15880 [Xanthobacteraceae bacterium]|nr:hypothetical protein [Xanthobacteraceae bacterium]